MRTLPKMYTSLADWFIVLTPPEHYVEEAAWLIPHLGEPESLLELGSGGGHLAHHLSDIEEVVLSDLSKEMLAASERLNPTREHVQGDMRTLRLDRTFDAVLIHDAIMYMHTERELLDALQTARAHLSKGGRLIVQPDFVAEGYEPGTSHGGSDQPDGRSLRYLEWSFPVREGETTGEVHFTITTRSADGQMQVHSDAHTFGVFARKTWLDLLEEAKFKAVIVIDDWEREVFIANAV